MAPSVITRTIQNFRQQPFGSIFEKYAGEHLRHPHFNEGLTLHVLVLFMLNSKEQMLWSYSNFDFYILIVYWFQRNYFDIFTSCRYWKVTHNPSEILWRFTQNQRMWPTDKNCFLLLLLMLKLFSDHICHTMITHKFIVHCKFCDNGSNCIIIILIYSESNRFSINDHER